MILKRIKQYIVGTSACGVPTSMIKTTVHTVYPDKTISFNDWSRNIQKLLYDLYLANRKV